MSSPPIITAVLPFDFEGTPVRTIQANGQIFFVAADVAKILEIQRTNDAIDRLDEDERGAVTIRTPGGPQEMSVITESGLYALILTSRKPNAKIFRKWVTSEVIPSIRRTGSYTHSENTSGPTEADELGFRTLKAFLKAAGVMEDQANNAVALSGLVVDHVDELRKKTASLRVEEAHLGIALKHAIDMIEATAIRPPALLEQKLRAAYAEIDQLRDRERAVYDRLLAATNEIVALRLKKAKAKTTARQPV